MWSIWNTHQIAGGVQTDSTTLENYSVSLLKLNNSYHNDIAISLLATYPREMSAYVNKIRCTKMFTAALTIISPNWKWPKCQLPREYTNELWYNHEIEYYTVIKSNYSYVQRHESHMHYVGRNIKS